MRWQATHLGRSSEHRCFLCWGVRPGQSRPNGEVGGLAYCSAVLALVNQISISGSVDHVCAEFRTAEHRGSGSRGGPPPSPPPRGGPPSLASIQTRCHTTRGRSPRRIGHQGEGVTYCLSGDGPSLFPVVGRRGCRASGARVSRKGLGIHSPQGAVEAVALMVDWQRFNTQQLGDGPVLSRSIQPAESSLVKKQGSRTWRRNL